MATPKEMNRTSGVARRKAPNASYNNSPFKGSDPLSQIASFAWRLPGAIASGRTLSGRKVTGEEVSGLAAMAALAGAGIYAGTRGVRGTRPASGTNAGRSGARPMTTAERSAAVTRAGKTGYGPGYIGKGVNNMYDNTYGSGLPYKGDIWDEVVTSRYSEVYGAGLKALEKKRRVSGPADYMRVTDNQAETIYKGHTTPMHVYGGSTVPVIPKYMQRTLLNRLDRRNRLKRSAGK